VPLGQNGVGYQIKKSHRKIQQGYGDILKIVMLPKKSKMGLSNLYVYSFFYFRFILHTALLDMIAGICWECMIWFPYFLPYAWIYEVLKQILVLSMSLAVMSALPLAVDRFLSLHYPTFEKTNNIIFLSIFIYDITTVILSYVTTNFAAAYVNPAYTLLFMIITVGILLSVFAKIRAMIQLAGTNAQQSTLRDLRRAAIVCLIQTLCLSTHLSFYLYDTLFIKALRYDPNLSKGFLIVFIIIDPILTVMFQFFVIVDCLSKLIVLKAYRSPVEKFCMYVVNFFLCGRFGVKKVQKKGQTGMNYPAADKA
jgi:hypothetical protein